MRRVCRVVVVIQSGYYGLTGVWPLVSLATFEMVTGPKTDDWLVQTVGVLALTIGVALFVGALRDVLSRETFVLAIGSAAAFAGVDLVFALQGRISRIYLVDAVIQLAFIAVLLIGWYNQRRSR